MPNQQTARLRAETIMKVRCGLFTARQAAVRMGVSPKTFYKWEQLGLSALLDRVIDRHSGRPPDPSDDRCQALEKRLWEAKREIGILNRNGAFGESISRRELNAMVIEARNESNHRQKSEMCRIRWLRLNLVWAMDDCQKSDTASGKLHLHNLTDLCSRTSCHRSPRGVCPEAKRWPAIWHICSTASVRRCSASGTTGAT